MGRPGLAPIDSTGRIRQGTLPCLYQLGDGFAAPRRAQLYNERC
jgi:hypothetical protein